MNLTETKDIDRNKLKSVKINGENIDLKKIVSIDIDNKLLPYFYSYALIVVNQLLDFDIDQEIILDIEFKNINFEYAFLVQSIKKDIGLCSTELKLKSSVRS